MSRYLSFLRKKMHGGQVDTEREPGAHTKGKNTKKLHRLKQNNVAPCSIPAGPEIDTHSGNSDNDSLLDNQSYGDADDHGTDKYDNFTENEVDEGVHYDGTDDLIDDVMDEALTGLGDNNFDSGFPCCTSPSSEEMVSVDPVEYHGAIEGSSKVLPKCVSSSHASLHSEWSPSRNVSKSETSLTQKPILVRFQSCPSLSFNWELCETPTQPSSSEEEFRSALEAFSADDAMQDTDTTSVGSSLSNESFHESNLRTNDITIPTQISDCDPEFLECEKLALIESAKNESAKNIRFVRSDLRSSEAIYIQSKSSELIHDQIDSTLECDQICSKPSELQLPEPAAKSKDTNLCLSEQICEPLESTELHNSMDVVQSALIQSVFSDHAEAEARLAQKRAARAEAREMRLKELEKNQQEEDNEEEQQYAANSFTPAKDRSRKSSLRAQTSNPKTPRSSVSRQSMANSNANFSRRSSEDSGDETPSTASEVKAELKDVEEKFRKAMITNAQLDNEKSTLTYEVEFIKDKFTELEESHTQLNKEHRKKCSENEQLRKLSNKLKDEVSMVRKVLQERDELIQEYGLIVVGEEEENDEFHDALDEEMMDDTINNLSPRKIAIKKALLSQEAAELLAKGATSGSLDVRLKKYAEEKNELEDEVRRLRLELEEELYRRRKENGLDNEKQKEASKSLNDHKLRIQKYEAEVSTLQANVARLESLVTRYKSQSEELEKSEEELKLEKRKLMRELRDAQNRLEEIEVTNSHLQKRFEKLKNARSNLLKDLSQHPA